MIRRYDPLVPPDATQWLALPEDLRRRLVEAYHRRTRVRLPNHTVPAIAHVVVENQIALGEETPVRRTAERLMREGLDRHDTIHAIGSVLMNFIVDVRQGQSEDAAPTEAYYAALDGLSAAGWVREFGGDAP